MSRWSGDHATCKGVLEEGIGDEERGTGVRYRDYAVSTNVISVGVASFFTPRVISPEICHYFPLFTDLRRSPSSFSLHKSPEICQNLLIFAYIRRSSPSSFFTKITGELLTPLSNLHISFILFFILTQISGELYPSPSNLRKYSLLSSHVDNRARRAWP